MPQVSRQQRKGREDGNYHTTTLEKQMEKNTDNEVDIRAKERLVGIYLVIEKRMAKPIIGDNGGTARRIRSLIRQR